MLPLVSPEFPVLDLVLAVTVGDGGALRGGACGDVLRPLLGALPLEGIVGPQSLLASYFAK